MNSEMLFFNGINGVNGEYLLPPMTSEQVAGIILSENREPEPIQLENKRPTRLTLGTRRTLGPGEGINPKNLAETGWGVIFAQGTDARIKDALRELLEHRRKQATKKDERYYQEYFDEEKAYRPGESKNDFLTRHGTGPGPADPEKVPYYLLIVGDPGVIPFSFQYQLDVQYAVGRIYFDTPEEYAGYAHGVVAAESRKFVLPRRAAFFGVQNPDDRPTELSANHLVKPLAEQFARDYKQWDVRLLLQDEATKEQLGRLLDGRETPAFLFTASHGIGFPSGDSRQLTQQGALLCQDWPGPKAWHEAIPQNFYFAADDLGSNAIPQGLLAFHFACYVAGTPRLDDFAHQTSGEPRAIAPNAFVAALPRKLLGHPKGGALAVVGHVDRAWGCSFMWGGAGPQLQVFTSTLKRLLEGHPIGSAMEYFNQRYAGLAADLSQKLEEIKYYGQKINALELTGMWMANNDARSYIIIGDPAVRLAVSDEASTATERIAFGSVRKHSLDVSDELSIDRHVIMGGTRG